MQSQGHEGRLKECISERIGWITPVCGIFTVPSAKIQLDRLTGTLVAAWVVRAA